jgi:hypothetical protein
MRAMRKVGVFIGILIAIKLLSLLLAEEEQHAVNLLLLIVMVAVPSFWFSSWSAENKKKQFEALVQRKHNETSALIDMINRQKKFSEISSEGCVLQKNEFAVHVEQSSMQEMKNKRISAGIGTRVKVGGLPIYLGGSQSQTRKYLSDAGTGKLVITNKRLIFSGQTSFSVNLSNITGLENGLDTIMVSTNKRATPVYFSVQNGITWSAYIRNLSKLGLTQNALSSDTLLTMD